MRHFSGEFKGVRPLMADELDRISGGDGEDTDDATTLDTIVVKANGDGSQTTWVPLVWNFGGGSPGTTADNPEAADTKSIHIDLKLTRALSATEQKALTDLNSSLQSIMHGLDAVQNNAQIKMANGVTVTAQEMKGYLSRLDFSVGEGQTFSNGSNTSESIFNNGDTQINLNIATLVNYNALAGGLNYFVLHELAHDTTANRTLYNSLYNDADHYTANDVTRVEQDANDIAKAVANASGVNTLANPTYGYGAVPTFAVPAPTPPPGGGGGGGGCVSIDALLPDGRRAGDVRVGDQLQLCDPVTQEETLGEVTYSEEKRVPMVRIVTQGGVTLDCSTTAPIPVRDGTLVLAPELLGQDVLVRAAGSIEFDRVAEVAVLPDGLVQHITVGDRCFWASNDGARFILHHNMKKVP